MAAPATLAPASRLPHLLVRGEAASVALPLRHGSAAALVAPSGGTWALVKRDDTELSSGSVTIASSIATATITPASSLDLGSGYELRWVLTIDGAPWHHRAPAYVVQWVPRCSCTVSDLYDRLPELAYRIPQAQAAAGTGWQPQIDAAYSELLQTLIDSGQRPWEIVGCEGYSAWLTARALQLAIEAIPRGIDTSWAEHAKAAAYKVRDAAGSMKILRDTSGPTAASRTGLGVVRFSPAYRASY
jgi:hypothetical protein